MWVDLPIGTKCYQHRSRPQSIERLVNLYADVSREGAKTPVSVLGTPGLLAWTEVGDGPIRGLHRAFGYVWAVSGEELYAISESTLASTLIGAIAGSGAVRMINNATHVTICASQFAYTANLTSIVTLPEESLHGAAFQDGYGIFAQRNTQNLWLSGLDDLTDIDGADFTTIDAQPDNLMTVISHQREVLPVKERTIEVWHNTGDAAFPFSRAGGGFIERGTYSPGSVAKGGQYVAFLGDDKRVYALQGYAAVPISTDDIENLIDDTASPETSEAFIYTQAGHAFYCLNFSDLSLAFDFTTGKWHERQSYGLERWRVQGYCQVGDTHLVGDYETGEIYELDLETYDEDGEILPATMVLPPISTDPEPITVDELFIDFETGVGLTTGQGSEPVALLDWSDDFGRTWSNTIEGNLGAIGDYGRRVKFNRLGRSYNRTFRIRITDPVKRVISGARARIRKGAH